MFPPKKRTDLLLKLSEAISFSKIQRQKRSTMPAESKVGSILRQTSGSKLGQSPRESHLKLTCHSLVFHLHTGFQPKNRTITNTQPVTYVTHAGLRNRLLQVRVLPGALVETKTYENDPPIFALSSS
jgi:hypothetical protein